MKKRKFVMFIEKSWSGVEVTESFEMPKDATEKEIQEEARRIFNSYYSYWYQEIEDE